MFSTNAITVIIDATDCVEEIMNNMTFVDDVELYTYVLSCIMETIVSNEQLIGENRPEFNEAVAYLSNFTRDEKRAYDICTKVLDLLIANITSHIPDFDHPRYVEDYNVGFGISNYDIYVTFTKKSE